MAWDLKEMQAQMRSMIGNPTEQQVFNRTLDRYLQNGVTQTGAMIGLPVLTTREMVPLEVNTHTYPLPADVLRVHEVWWNGSPLEFSSIETWRRDRVNWRGEEAGPPREVAVDARELFLYPRPDTSALATDGALDVRVLLTGHRLEANGITGFSDADVLLAVRLAAVEYMGSNNPDGRYDRGLKFQLEMIAREEVAAKQRYAQMLAGSDQGMSAWTGRTGPAR